MQEKSHQEIKVMMILWDELGCEKLSFSHRVRACGHGDDEINIGRGVLQLHIRGASFPVATTKMAGNCR